MTITIVMRMTFQLNFYVLPTEVYYHGHFDFFYFRSHGINLHSAPYTSGLSVISDTWRAKLVKISLRSLMVNHEPGMARYEFRTDLSNLASFDLQLKSRR
jgi:hypothetical protein